MNEHLGQLPKVLTTYQHTSIRQVLLWVFRKMMMRIQKIRMSHHFTSYMLCVCCFLSFVVWLNGERESV